MPEKELIRLQSVHRFLKLELNVELELKAMVEELSEVCSVPIAMITLWDGGMQHTRCRVGTVPDEMPGPLAEAFHVYAAGEGGLVIVENAQRDGRTVANPYVCNPPYLKFYAGTPLVSADGSTIGMLGVWDYVARSLQPAQQQMIAAIARQVVNLMEFEESLNLLKGQYISSRQNAIKLHSYFESSASCHLLLDSDMLVLSFNKALDDITFLYHGIHLQEGDPMIQYVHPDFRAEFISCFNRALGGETASLEQDLQYPQGRICWYMTFSPARNPGSEIIGVSFNAIDITASVIQKERIAESEKWLNEIARIQLQEIQKASEDLIRSMSLFNKEASHENAEELTLLDRAVEELKLFIKAE